MTAEGGAGDVARVFRAEHGRVVAGLIRAFGSIDVAEDAVSDAFATALEKWPEQGMPPNPGAWIATTARNRGLDRLRRESRGRQLVVKAYRESGPSNDAEPADSAETEGGGVRDDRLRLIFTCCHPALAEEARIALTLRLLGGLTTTEIARAFLVPEATMAARITRAKHKIRSAGVPYRVPAEADLPDRLRSVLAVLYLVFTEGHSASGGDGLVREDLCAEAIRLGRLVAELMPDEPEALGLVALMLLTRARSRARTRPDGSLVLLADQDRGLWDRAMIAEGHAVVRECLRRSRPGPYQVQAAIAAVHADAPRAEDTDWAQIVALYDQLLAVAPTPVVALNRAVAIAQTAGPAAGLAATAGLAERLREYQPFHAARGDFLRRLGRRDESADAFRAALALTTNAAQRQFIEARLREAAPPG
ncbi:MAG: RNA polymerase sigma factor [Segniliparus sp.]|uniref:RNA polymerase sigma factor n=1 Tax=Segniliparus sp. TaxID=2804064 RepID=UPI003F3E8ACB